MKKVIWTLSVVVLATMFGADGFAQDKKKRAAGVHVDAVILEPLTQTMPVLGRFVARQSGVVAALTRGPVNSVRVAVGDRINIGDVLADLVTRALSPRRFFARQSSGSGRRGGKRPRRS
ncbi:MAG: efflux RND transporter periplasmic adaptor subunit [Alphaproteobacteria bacterium]|nr:efflux RND transporter periplasmic adaptor subunit [Alphaproteobacteria bacterium]